MMKIFCIGWFTNHTWGKWSNYERGYTYTHPLTLVHGEGIQVRERRTCAVCGALQDRKVI